MYAITATPIAGGQSFVISDGTGARGPGGKLFVNDFQGQYDGQVQRVSYLEAPAVTNVVPTSFSHNGNIPLSVEYEFATEGECFAFIRNLQTACPVLANVTVSAGNYTATMARVFLRPLKFRTIGQVSVRVEYPLTFGLWTFST